MQKGADEDDKERAALLAKINRLENALEWEDSTVLLATISMLKTELEEQKTTINGLGAANAKLMEKRTHLGQEVAACR